MHHTYVLPAPSLDLRVILHFPLRGRGVEGRSGVASRVDTGDNDFRLYQSLLMIPSPTSPIFLAHASLPLPDSVQRTDLLLSLSAAVPKQILDLHPLLIFHLHLLHLYELLLAPTSPAAPTNLSSTLLFASETLAPLALNSPTHLAELEDALSLLLVPQTSPSAAGGGGEKQARREKVAKELNAAILEGQGRGCESRLVGVWRCLKWGEAELGRK